MPLAGGSVKCGIAAFQRIRDRFAGRQCIPKAAMLGNG
jgi:hypothetical protein